jgi:hypothetical protein
MSKYPITNVGVSVHHIKEGYSFVWVTIARHGGARSAYLKHSGKPYMARRRHASRAQKMQDKILRQSLLEESKLVELAGCERDDNV